MPPAAPAQPAAPAAKPGWKTTEFWLTLLSALAPAVNTASDLIFHVSIPTDQLQAGMTAAAVYVGSRSGVKAMSAYLAARAQPTYKVNP
jgi:hypothetical protein